MVLGFELMFGLGGILVCVKIQWMRKLRDFDLNGHLLFAQHNSIET